MLRAAILFLVGRSHGWLSRVAAIDELAALAEQRGAVLSLVKLGKHYGGRTLFEGVSLKLVPGHRYGLVGANGSGKSTLLRLLCGDEESSEGSVQPDKGTRLGVLRQDRFLDDREGILEVATLVGAPLPVAPFLAQGQGADDAEGVRALTEAIDAALREVTVNLEAWEDLPLLQAVDALWRIDDPEHAARLKLLADGVVTLRQRAPEKLAVARARVGEWVERLRRLGLRPRDLAPEGGVARASPAKVASFALRQLAIAVLLLPVALFGAVFFAVPFWAVHALYLVGRPTADVAASVKVVASLVFFPLWHLVATGGLSLWLGLPWALAIAAVAPLCGMTTRWFFRSRLRALRDAAVFVRLLFARPLVRRLERERDELVAAIDELAALAEPR